ncbi:MAG: phosphopyruvate hydratase [Gemmataceae bacterium]|nr:phosphopyruvate hydratase [Gemmataceae bacterium]
MAGGVIETIHAREVLDSRGNPTVEVEVRCGAAVGRAIVPSGASTGRHEALELRDHDPARYAGKGVRRAVANVHEHIAPHLLGMPASAQRDIDHKLIALDGTADKSRLGANAILGVSLACAHAAAAARGVALWQYLDTGAARMPLPMVNLISGGLHAGRNLEFQDFLLIPIGARGYSEALQITVAVYRALAGLLQEGGFEGVLVGDEGGFGPKLANNEEAVKIVVAAIERAGLTPGRDAAIALDVASTHFHDAGQYLLRDRVLDAAGLTRLLAAWVGQHPIVSIEDGMAEDDWAGWRQLTQALGGRVQLIGDDLFVTNPVRLARGIQEGVANSVLIKVNQIGTLTETLDVIAQARAAGYRPVISARSGETEDTTIADLAVATGAGQIKIGSVARGERLAKYNQLLRIEEQMGANAPFAKWEPMEN